jgi:hypothetical protein
MFYKISEKGGQQIVLQEVKVVDHQAGFIFASD